MHKRHAWFFGFFVSLLFFVSTACTVSAAENEDIKKELKEEMTGDHVKEIFENSKPTTPSMEAPPPMQQSNTVSKDEVSNFKREMGDVSRQVKELQKQMNIPKQRKTSKRQLTVPKETEESMEGWKKTLNDTLKDIENCVKDVKNATSEDKRAFIDDCRGNNFWDVVNDIRDEFVPPQDLLNAINESDRQLKELTKFKRKLTSATSKMRKFTSGIPDTSTSGTLSIIQKLNDQIVEQQNSILGAKGRDQREMMNDFYSSNFHEEINKIRSMVELPNEMSNVSKDMTFALSDASKKSMEKAYAFFGVEKAQVLEILNIKKLAVDQIIDLMKADKYDEAMELAEEEIHQGWHPGDARHLLGMVREAYDRMKGMKDAELKETVVGVVKPILEGFILGDVRDARDAMVQFTDQMRAYERFFRPSYDRGRRKLDKNMMKALNKVESLIQQKIEKGEIKEDMGDMSDDHDEGDRDEDNER